METGLFDTVSEHQFIKAEKDFYRAWLGLQASLLYTKKLSARTILPRPINLLSALHIFE